MQPIISGATAFAATTEKFSNHPKYTYRLNQWVKCRDAYEGEDRIKSKGEKYLPRLSGQSDEDYKRYLYRALFYSITSKSLSALTGMALTADRKLEYPERMERYFKGHGPNRFNEVLSMAIGEVLLQGRIGMLIDSPSTGDPYVAVYKAEDIINWRTNDQGEPTFVMLKEEYENDLGDGYSFDLEIRYIELRLDNGVYKQTIYESGEQGKTITPTFSGNTLNYIPFVVAHPQGVGFVDCKPPMLDIANINISHYLSSADLEHGRHFTGLPTPVVTGCEINTPLHIGSTRFIVLPDKGSTANYLEFTGQGLQSLEKAMAEKQSLLASMSARLMDNNSRGSEAAEAVKLRYSSETASLRSVVEAVNMALQYVYSNIATMIRENGSDVSIILGTEFMETYMSPTEMTALFDGYINGAIGIETLVFNLRKGRRLNPLTDDEKIISELKSIANERKLERKAQITKPADNPQTME